MKTSGSKLGVRMGMGRGSPRHSGIASHADNTVAASSKPPADEASNGNETVRIAGTALSSERLIGR
jgi:hypothetical protein